MKLFYADPSPFARKVRVVAHETGQVAKLELVTAPVNPVEPNKDVAKHNPLVKVPTLITDDGETLFDSSVICQYLDSLHGGAKLVPERGAARWKALRLEALADGMTDAGILSRYETLLRPEDKRWTPWVDGQIGKLKAGLDQAEREAGELEGPLTIGQIALGCALGWMEFRKVGGDIRKGHPKLFHWYDRFAKRPSMQETQPKG